MGLPPSPLALVRSSWMAYQEHLSTDFRSYINILINLASAVFSLSSISPWSFGPATLIPIFKGTYSIETKELQMQIWKSRQKFHSYFPPFFTRYIFQMELIKQLSISYLVWICIWDTCQFTLFSFFYKWPGPALGHLLLWGWDLTQLRGGKDPTYLTVYYLHVSIFNFLSPLHTF